MKMLMFGIALLLFSIVWLFFWNRGNSQFAYITDYGTMILAITGLFISIIGLIKKDK
jgi:hypothetical protein